MYVAVLYDVEVKLCKSVQPMAPNLYENSRFSAASAVSQVASVEPIRK